MKIAIVLLPVKNVSPFHCCDVLVFGKGKFVKNIYKLGSNKFSSADTSAVSPRSKILRKPTVVSPFAVLGLLYKTH